MSDRAPSADVDLGRLSAYLETASGVLSAKDPDLPTPVLIAGDLRGSERFRNPVTWSVGLIANGVAGVFSIAGVQCVNGILVIDRVYAEVAAGQEVLIKLDRKTSTVYPGVGTLLFPTNGDRENGDRAPGEKRSGTIAGTGGNLIWRQLTKVEDWTHRIVLFPGDILYCSAGAVNQTLRAGFTGISYEV